VPDFAGNPALSPQEQAYAGATPSIAGIRSLLKTPAKPPAEFTLSPEEQVMSAIGAPSTEPVVAQAPKEPRPPSEARPMEELGKGVESAAKIALPSMWEQAGIYKDVGALGTVQKRLDLFNKIETGEITSPDQLRGLDISTSQARAYFGADPVMREKIRSRTVDEIGRRKEFVSASLETLDQYQKDSVKYKGRTTDLTDVENVKDFANWLGYNVGSGAVQMAPIMLAAVTTGPGGVALLGAGMGTAQAVDDRLNFLKDQVKDMPRDKRADAVVDYITKTGDTTLAVGIINGMLDSVLGPDAALAKRGLKQVVTGETKKQALKAGVKEVPKQMAEEFITGGAQQATQIAGQVREKEQEEFLTEKNLKEILNAAAAEAAGAVGGGAATTGARVYGAKTGEQTRAEVLAKALEEGTKGATVNQTALDELVRQSLNPDAGVRQGTNVRADIPGLEITPPTARPGVPTPTGGTPITPPLAGIAGLTAAPSESMDTEAMLREALGQAPAGVATLPPVNVETPKVPEIQPTVAEAGPFVRKQMEEPTPTTPTPLSIEGALSGIETPKAKQAEAQGQQAPAAPVTLYRGVPQGQEQRDTVGGAQFMSPDRKVAEMYAGPNGSVSEEVHLFKNPLQAPTWADAKNNLGLPQSATMADLVDAARKAGHDGVTFNTTNGPEYIVIGKKAPTAPTERLTLGNLKDRPIEEQYTIINTVSFNAKKAFREGRISQDQLDKIQAEKDRIIEEVDQKTLSNPTPDQKEALDLAEQIEVAGQKDFADTVRNSVKRGIFKKESLPFYKEKLQEFQAKQGKTEAKEEGFKWSEFLHPNEQKYYDVFQKTASPEAKATFDKVGTAIQDVTTALNNLGYQVNDTKFPLGLGNLKTQYSNLLSDGLKILRDHYAIQNEYKRADADKFDLSIKRANDSVAQAQQVIRKAVPRPEEITEAEQRVGEGEKAVSKIKGKPGRSLWTALTGKLGSSDIAELFGKSPQIYQKKLQAKKGSSGKSIADMVSDGDLDDFLPFQMRSSVPGFDGQDAEEYIKEQIRGQNYIPYDAQVEIEQIFGSVEEAEKLINDYLTTEEQNLELQEAADEQRQGEIDARSVEPESEIPSAEPDEGETLTSPTPEGLKAKEEYRKKAEEAEAAKAKANKEAEDRAKAEREVGEFTLTGSERAADVAAAQGQKDIFAQEEEEPAVNEDGVKVVPFEADSTTVGELLSETRNEENPYDIRYNALMHAAEKPAKPKPQEMLTPEEAKAQLEEWKAEAKRQGKTSKNFNRTIMSLFDASGEWARPWQEAGYSVYTFDIQTGQDINDFSAEYLLNEGFGDMEIWGILAAPPCTDFASSGAQFWAKKDAKGQTELSNDLVKQVLRTVEFLQPKIWALENPVGRIAKLNNLPPAHLTFDPNFYGDPYTKKTLLWGNFENDLPLAPVEPTEGSKIVKLSGKDKYARSLTPEGFAYAFFMANNAESMTPAERLTRTYYGVNPKAFEGATEADEEAIDGSEFQDFYYDGNLDEAADIARDIIGGKQEIQEELPSEDYQKAMDESNKAIKAFNKIQKAYRAQEISDDEFLAGRKIYDAAMKKFDEAYAAEQKPAKPEPVKTPEGGTMRYPLASVLFNDGYEVLPLKDPRTYVDKGGEAHRTFEKDGVRVSLTPQLVLFQNKNAVLTGQGESTDLVINALLVDQAKRNQGKANEALQNIVDAADQYGVTLYIEPVPLVNLKEKDFGLDSQQLEDLYKKFGFDFAEDSNKVMVREPEVEVLGPAEKPAAPRLTNEPYTIEGDFTEIGEEKQHALLSDQTSKLSEDQTKSLESQYGAKRDSTEFLDSLRKDVIAFITEGAQAVNGKIRAIIKQIANGVLSVAIVFNPQFVSKPYTIAVPQYDIKTSEVIKDLPKEAQSMSDAAKRAYGVIYPALEAQLKANDKLFIVADKRSGNTYLFNPDGSLLLQSKTLFGKAIGDYMHGDNEIVANRITPAGVFDLGLRDAKRSAGEAYTAGDYDFGKVFVLDKSHMGKNGPYSNTIMHSVWMNETDAKQRLAALDKPGAEDSRYSFGCINVNKETFKYLITNHLNQMDGAKIFIVPENGANVMDFINGKAMYSDDIIRQKVEPVTKTTVTEKKVPTPKPGVERKVSGREAEVAKLEVKTEEEAPGKEPKEPKEQNFYSLDGYVNEEKEKRSPSLIRKLKTLNRQHKEGKLSDEQYITMSDEAIRADYENKFYDPVMARKRGYLLIQEKLSAAARRGEISREIFDLANWFMSQNEDLVSDLGISIRGKGQAGVGGFYNNLSRVFTLMKGASSDLTAVHEILHHLERMMPAKVQQAIRKAWADQLTKANKQAKTPAEKLYFAALMEAHYGSNQHSMLNIPEGAGKDYAKVREALEYEPGDGSSANFAETMLKLGLVPMANYEYVNPSEFWAVNGSDIVKARYDAVQGGVLARLKNWLKEFIQKAKSLFGLKSDASIIRALDSLAKSDGEFLSKEMLGQGDYFSIERRNFRGNEAPEPVFEAPVPSAMDTFAYNFLDKQHDMRSVIDEIQKVRGKLVDERIDPYLKNESFISRKAAREENFVDNLIMPIVQEMYKNKVSIIEVEEYIHNRHAEERNIQVAKINPALPDGGSGITTANALKYLNELPENKLKIYNKIAKMFDGIVDETQKVLVDSGAETQKTINDWNNTYEYYAPLQREDLDFVNHGVGNGGGLGSRGSFSKRAFGSTKNVANILQNIVLQHKRAIDRAERIRVGKSLMGLVLTNPNPNFWIPVNPNAIKSVKKFKQEVQSLGISEDQAENMLQEPKSPSIDKETGLVKYAVNPAMRSMDNVFPVRINGQDWFIIFNPSDERAMRMVKSLRNLDVEKLGIFLGTAGMITRWISAINTQYNPIFGAFNFGRDVGTGLLQLSTTELAGQQGKVMKSVMPALAAIFKEQRGWSKSKDVLEKGELTPQEWRDLYHRYKMAGGKTGISSNFTQQKTRIEKLEKGWGMKGLLSLRATTDEISLIDKKLAEMDRGKIMAGAHWLFDYLSDYNEAMENAVRLATFKVAVLDNNMSDDKAASLAKNVTVNFDKKGAVVPKLQAWFSFINPGIRGAVLVKNVLTGPKGKAIIAGGIGLGIMQALVLFAAGFDDDDPPEFVKSKAFVIPTGGGKYFVMYPPYPPGFSMLPGIGRMLTEAFLIKSKMMKSNESASDKIFDILPMMLDSVNPLGIGSTWQQLTPTPLDPLVNVKVNEDAFGRPIAKKDRPGEETPGYERSRDSASAISKGIAYFLNWASSPPGTEHTKGKISPTADQLDYLAEQYFGGVFREMVKAGESIGAAVKGEEQPMYRVPVAGKFFGETKTPAATSSRFYDNIERMNTFEHEIKKRQEKREPVTEYLKDNPTAHLWREANAAQKAVGDINKEKRLAVERNASKEVINAIDARKVKAMKAFNDKVRAAQ
jgi:site-specific DNA-cytosine methylase